jgi:hypothetical protein
VILAIGRPESVGAAKPGSAEALWDQAVVPAAIPERAPGKLGNTTAVEPTAALTMIDRSGIERFRDSVEYLNERTLELAGGRVFADVRPSVGGAIEIGATDAWDALSPALQTSYLNTLLDRWAAVHGAGAPVALRLVDCSGRLVSERRKP